MPYRAVALGPEHVEAVYSLHRVAHSLASRPDLVRLDTREYFASHIAQHGFILGILVGNDLVGYGLASLPSTDAENYGTLLRLPRSEFPLVGQLEGAAVHLDWWGRGLHHMLARWRISCLADDGRRHICATVAPRNIWSLNNLLRVGMTVRRIATLYGGLTRYVMQWEGAAYVPPASQPGDRVVDLDDLQAQAALLDAGWRGTLLQRVEGDRWTLTFRPPPGVSP